MRRRIPAATVASTSSVTPNAVAPAPGANGCRRPLSEYCGPRGCGDFERTAADLRALVARYKGNGCLQYARIGRCGRLSFVKQSDGFSGNTKYFDEHGAIVAVEAGSDTSSYCEGHAFGATFGEHEPCTQVASEDLCPNG